MKTTLKNEDDLKNGYDLKNEDDHKNEDNLKKEDGLKNEDNLKNVWRDTCNVSKYLTWLYTFIFISWLVWGSGKHIKPKQTQK